MNKLGTLYTLLRELIVSRYIRSCLDKFATHFLNDNITWCSLPTLAYIKHGLFTHKHLWMAQFFQKRKVIFICWIIHNNPFLVYRNLTFYRFKTTLNFIRRTKCCSKYWKLWTIHFTISYNISNIWFINIIIQVIGYNVSKLPIIYYVSRCQYN